MVKFTLASTLAAAALFLGNALAAPAGELEARSSTKKINICGQPFTVPYPGPQDVMNNAKYASARYYYTANMGEAAHENVNDWNIAMTRAPLAIFTEDKGYYDTEHIMEAQTVGKFFGKHCRKFSRSETKRAVQAAIDQLGTKDHPDRLVMLERDLNGEKASLFAKKLPVSKSTFKKAVEEEQLIYAQSVGALVSYMNDPFVWGRFCNTYFAVYDALGSAAVPAKLRAGLKKDFTTHITDTLASFGEMAKKDMAMFYANKKAGYKDDIWRGHQNINLGINRAGCRRNIGGGNFAGRA